VLTVRGQDYVLAARALGVPSARILRLTVLPNVAGPIIALATVLVPGVLLAAAGLAFIGLGAQPPVPEWGALLVAGRLDLATAPWLAIFPGLALFLTVLGATLFGQALRDALDPRI
jgi:peptide/nickel transport system permease protein